MKNIRKILQETIDSIEKTTACFYQNRNDEGYQSLYYTLIKLEYALNETVQFCQQENAMDINEDEMLEKLGRAMNAMEEKDLSLLSDILEYEIKETLEQWCASL